MCRVFFGKYTENLKSRNSITKVSIMSLFHSIFFFQVCCLDIQLASYKQIKLFESLNQEPGYFVQMTKFLSIVLNH